MAGRTEAAPLSDRKCSPPEPAAPEDVHLPNGNHSEEEDEREATELGIVTGFQAYQGTPATTASDAGSSVRRNRLRRQAPGRFHGISKFWKHQVQLAVPHNDCRDHLGKCIYV